MGPWKWGIQDSIIYYQSPEEDHQATDKPQLEFPRKCLAQNRNILNDNMWRVDLGVISNSNSQQPDGQGQKIIHYGSS